MMAGLNREERFLRYQIRAIRRFQKLRQPRTPDEAQRLALEWIRRFARSARSRWEGRWSGNGPGAQPEQKVPLAWKI